MKDDLEIFLEKQKRGQTKKLVMWVSFTLIFAAVIIISLFELFDVAMKSIVGN